MPPPRWHRQGWTTLKNDHSTILALFQTCSLDLEYLASLFVKIKCDREPLEEEERHFWVWRSSWWNFEFARVFARKESKKIAGKNNICPPTDFRVGGRERHPIVSSSSITHHHCTTNPLSSIDWDSFRRTKTRRLHTCSIDCFHHDDFQTTRATTSQW